MCGTIDDDGERMVECEVCEDWFHTRCIGTPDSAESPSPWTCPRCKIDPVKGAAIKAVKEVKKSAKEASDEAAAVSEAAEAAAVAAAGVVDCL